MYTQATSGYIILKELKKMQNRIGWKRSGLLRRLQILMVVQNTFTMLPSHKIQLSLSLVAMSFLLSWHACQVWISTTSIMILQIGSLKAFGCNWPIYLSRSFSSRTPWRWSTWQWHVCWHYTTLFNNRHMRLQGFLLTEQHPSLLQYDAQNDKLWVSLLWTSRNTLL